MSIRRIKVMKKHKYASYNHDPANAKILNRLVRVIYMIGKLRMELGTA